MEKHREIDTMDTSMIERIVQTTGDIPAMPQVANMVLDRISDPNATPKEIQLIISKDQALAARVLKVANSSFYGLSRSVTRISDAIVVMGFNSLRSLVMTTVLNDLFKSFGLA
ncbi:MAG: HDOD domain-containing protein, partial [Syntrophobacteraceae bacterium]|nr:HDOD domain-containing protein [Syntrophobacteraceae bacterium]